MNARAGGELLRAHRIRNIRFRLEGRDGVLALLQLGTRTGRIRLLFFDCAAATVAVAVAGDRVIAAGPSFCTDAAAGRRAVYGSRASGRFTRTTKAARRPIDIARATRRSFQTADTGGGKLRATRLAAESRTVRGDSAVSWSSRTRACDRIRAGSLCTEFAAACPATGTRDTAATRPERTGTARPARTRAADTTTAGKRGVKRSGRSLLTADVAQSDRRAGARTGESRTARCDTRATDRRTARSRDGDPVVRSGKLRLCDTGSRCDHGSTGGRALGSDNLTRCHGAAWHKRERVRIVRIAVQTLQNFGTGGKRSGRGYRSADTAGRRAVQNGGIARRCGIDRKRPVVARAGRRYRPCAGHRSGTGRSRACRADTDRVTATGIGCFFPQLGKAFPGRGDRCRCPDRLTDRTVTSRRGHRIGLAKF